MGTRLPLGQAFEREVVELLRLMGYVVSHNELVAGTQIDIVARKFDPLEPSCLLVECGDYKTPVGVDMIKRKAAVLVGTEGEPELYRMLYVARNGFTAEAKNFAKKNMRVLIRTPGDLEQELINFTPYIDWYCRQYREGEGLFREHSLAGIFIDPAATEGSKRHESALRATTDWVRQSNNQLLFVLGEYGSGKTSLVRNFTYELLTQHFAQGHEFTAIPILINLRDYRRTFNIQQMVMDTLSGQYGVRMSSFASFERLASRDESSSCSTASTKWFHRWMSP